MKDDPNQLATKITLTCPEPTCPEPSRRGRRVARIAWHLSYSDLTTPCMFNVFEATVIWDGQIKFIEINESETDPLVGMGLLEGYELNIQAGD